MSSTSYAFPIYGSATWIITFVVSFLVLLFWVLFATFGFHNKRYAMFLTGFSLVYLICLCFGLNQLSVFFLFAILVVSMMLIIRHFKEFKNIEFGIRFGHRVIKGEKLYDREKLYNTVESAVSYFSHHKTGALMTFVKKDALEEEIKTGVRIDAPVSLELLQTIFYVGTRLHDGALIIDGNKIVAASCLYQPTVEPVSGKLGLRHRAALGISEISDSVTIVVSEETGRISIAHKGELENYSIEAFKAAFIEAMEE